MNCQKIYLLAVDVFYRGRFISQTFKLYFRIWLDIHGMFANVRPPFKNGRIFPLGQRGCLLRVQNGGDGQSSGYGDSGLSAELQVQG